MLVEEGLDFLVIEVVVEQLRVVGLCLLVVALERRVKDIVYKDIVQTEVEDEIVMGKMDCFLSIPVARFGLELVENTMFSMASGDSIQIFFDYL